MGIMIPNIITTFRLFLIPFFTYLILIRDNIWGACTVFLISGISDVVDGVIARKCGMITETGKVFDPLVDKLMQITVMACLAVRGFIPFWVIAIVIIKELVMIIVCFILYIKKVIVQSKWYGKVSTVVFYAVILILVIFDTLPDIIEKILLVILAFSMIFSAFAYLIQFITDKRDGSNKVISSGTIEKKS